MDTMKSMTQEWMKVFQFARVEMCHRKVLEYCPEIRISQKRSSDHWESNHSCTQVGKTTMAFQCFLIEQRQS